MTFHFLWFDFWIGLYYDQDTGTYYLCPLPMLVYKFTPPHPKKKKGDEVLEMYRKAARKQQHALEQGGWGHAIWCNFQHHKNPTQTFCNCGITDMVRAYEKDMSA